MFKKITFIILFTCISQQAFCDHLIDVEKALQKVYTKATEFEEVYVALSDEQVRQIEEGADINFAGSHSARLIKYNAYENGRIIGSAYEDTVIGKWGPIHYIVGLDSAGEVLDSVILDFDEIRGRPVAKRRFLKQYRGKSVNDPVRLRRDIDGVTGATISSRSLTDGVRKILYVHELVKNQ